VKVLGGGDVRRELYVTADAFSDSARELIETGGGEARLSARGRAEAETDRDSNDEPEN
jgi:large subunit ribosomal protein L15